MKTFLNKANKIAATTLTIASLGYASSAVSDIPGYTEWDAPSPWTTVASSCAVDESAVNKYAFNYADFYYLGSAVSSPNRKTGYNPISVRCNVDNPLDNDVRPKWDTLIIGYNDPDLEKKDASVVARLVQVKRATGLTSVVATFDSNTSSLTGRREGFVKFTSILDFHNNAYFVQLNLTRANANVATPTVYSARLVSTTGIPK